MHTLSLTAFIICWVGCAVSFAVGVASGYRALAHRRPGVSLLNPFAKYMLTPEGERHARRHRRAVAAFLAFCALAVLVGQGMRRS